MQGGTSDSIATETFLWRAAPVSPTNGFTQKITELKSAPLSANWLINTQGFMKITLEIYLIRNNSLCPLPFFSVFS